MDLVRRGIVARGEVGGVPAIGGHVFGSMDNVCVTIAAKAKFQVTGRPNPSTRSAWQVILPLALLDALINLFAFQIGQRVSEVLEWTAW